MNIFPYYSFAISTQLSKHACLTVIKQETEPYKWFRLETNHKLFQGDIQHETFKIVRIIHYRNSFMPVIHGSFLPQINGSRINIKMKMHPLIFGFLCVWFGGVGIGCIVSAYIILQDLTRISLPLFIPWIMLLFGIALINGCFWFEVNKTAPLLKKIFQAKKTN